MATPEHYRVRELESVCTPQAATHYKQPPLQIDHLNSLTHFRPVSHAEARHT
jgi:hypothetical protein